MVAAKATGKAREFRRKVETMAVCREAAQARLLEPFQPKPGFQPMPRKMHLDRLAKHWKRMPRLGRLGVKVELDREGLEIRETACSAMRLRALGSASYCSNPPGAALVPPVIRVMCLSACPRRMAVCETWQIP